MNNDRRKRLKAIMDEISELVEKLEIITEEEQEAFDNMPESLQMSERGENMEMYIYSLGEASEYLASASESIEEITQ